MQTAKCKGMRRPDEIHGSSGLANGRYINLGDELRLQGGAFYLLDRG